MFPHNDSLSCCINTIMRNSDVSYNLNSLHTLPYCKHGCRDVLLFFLAFDQSKAVMKYDSLSRA